MVREIIHTSSGAVRCYCLRLKRPERGNTWQKQIPASEIYEATSSIGYGFPGSESDDDHADVRLLEWCRCRNPWSVADGHFVKTL